MVLVDFTLAERWRVFGELSLRSVSRDAARGKFAAQTAQAAPPQASVKPVTAGLVQPHDQPSRRQAEALLMQRLL